MSEAGQKQPDTPEVQTCGLIAGYEAGLPIVKGIDLSVQPGEFLAILGPNGAGKSTFVKALAGLVPVFGGRVHISGRDVTDQPAHTRIRDGLAFVPQTENIFATLSIRENLAIAAASLPRPRRGEAMEAIFTRFPDLADRPGRSAGSLSGGQRQMLAAARALMTEPALLVLDEPSAGLSPRLVAEVLERLAVINGQGTTIILVEQNVRAALAVASRGIVLVEGAIRHDEDAAGLAERSDLAELFLGTAGNRIEVA